MSTDSLPTIKQYVYEYFMEVFRKQLTPQLVQRYSTGVNILTHIYDSYKELLQKHMQDILESKQQVTTQIESYTSAINIIQKDDIHGVREFIGRIVGENKELLTDTITRSDKQITTVDQILLDLTKDDIVQADVLEVAQHVQDILKTTRDEEDRVKQNVIKQYNSLISPATSDDKEVELYRLRHIDWCKGALSLAQENLATLETKQQQLTELITKVDQALWQLQK